MKLLNQPEEGQLGTLLNAELSKDYDRFIIVSAFAKMSGVSRLREKMVEFKENGGKIHAYIGVDSLGTSYEALEALLKLVDQLYIIHSETATTTFHSKIYYFEKKKKSGWINIGSHNLTGGGLWTNYETSVMKSIEHVKKSELVEDFKSMLKKHRKKTDICVEVTSQDTLEEFLENGYLIREEVSHASFSGQLKESRKKETLFGRTNYKLPSGKNTPQSVREEETDGSEEVEEPLERERFSIDLSASGNMWFETKSMTGGSVNILDLSKTGRVVYKDDHHPIAEQYILPEGTDKVAGGVTFFQVDPKEERNTEISVKYKDSLYSPCTIKFAPDNGSWRIQLKGKNEKGERLHNIEGSSWMKEKVFLFTYLSDGCYQLSAYESKHIQFFRKNSLLVAQNGSNNNSKRFGILNVTPEVKEFLEDSYFTNTQIAQD